MVCGSFGRGAEGHLLACSQCSQCYHPYCVNSKVSSGPKRSGLRDGVITAYPSSLSWPLYLKWPLVMEVVHQFPVVVKFILGKNTLETVVVFTSFFVVDHDLLV